MNKYMVKCPECKGEKFFYNSTWEDWHSQGAKHPPPDEPEELICGECEGEGVIPTQEGLEILELIRRFL